MVIASVMSTGGLTALVAKKLGARNYTKKLFQKQSPKEERWAK
jgi:hypothetical protein